MATTYQAIATVEVGSGGAANIEFTSIPATYTDLLLKISSRGNTDLGTPALKIVINSDTGNNYTYRLLYGSGSAAASLSGTLAYAYSGAANDPGDTANTFGNVEIYIPNYAGSNKKSISTDGITENNATAAIAALVAGLWDSTAAITSLTITIDGSNLVQYSTATLYGIKNS